jgi:chromosome segregation ATPase
MFKRSRMSSEARLKITGHADRIQQLNAQILDMLNQIQELQNDADPSNELARQQQPPQSDLQQQMQSLMQDIEKIEQTLPTADGSASEFGEQASEDMDSAIQYMQQYKGMSAEGMQRSAAQNIQNTRDRLQQQLNEYMQMQQQMQQMDPSDGEEGNQGDEQSDNEMELRPVNSQFNTLEDEKTPEEYRQELLEGMAADVPEEYRQQKKRYYEELVQQ